MFSPNTPSTVRDECKAHLGTQVGDAVGKYLGNFIEVNGRNLKVYQELVTKMQQKLQSWEHMCLSPAGHLLFANSILASLCTHDPLGGQVVTVPGSVRGDINSSNDGNRLVGPGRGLLETFNNLVPQQGNSLGTLLELAPSPPNLPIIYLPHQTLIKMTVEPLFCLEIPLEQPHPTQVESLHVAYPMECITIEVKS
ncbi:Mycosubtilin synthase subunit A [Bienertia sinuspersici]